MDRKLPMNHAMHALQYSHTGHWREIYYMYIQRVVRHTQFATSDLVQGDLFLTDKMSKNIQI